MKILLILLTLLFSFSAFSAERLKVFWNCYLPDDDVVCDEVKMIFFQASNREEAEVEDEAHLSLILRSLELNNVKEYQVTLEGELIKQPSPFYLQLNSSLDVDERTTKISGFIKEVTDPFVTIINNGNEEGETEKNSPTYGLTGIYGNGLRAQGSSNASLGIEGGVNYSTRKWRLAVGPYGGINYSSMKKSPFNPGLTSTIGYYGFESTVVRSIKDYTLNKSTARKGQWDVALFVRDRIVKNKLELDPADPQMDENALSNTARKTIISAGTEWILVPFKTETTEGNVAVRYAISGEHHKYVDPETFMYVQETFARHAFQFFFAKHYPKVDLSANVGAFASSFRKSQLKGLNASGSANFKLKEGLSIIVSANMQYTKNQVMSPAESSMSFSGLTSGNTPLTYGGSVGINYNLGNIRIFKREQRWKD